MARKPRIEFPGALYHVYSRGNQKQDIFLGAGDFNVFMDRLAEYKKKYDFILYAYALMRNHFHLLIETRDVGLSKIMQGLLLSYTQYYNLKYNKVGHLFQGRYKAVLCQHNLYLFALIRYIHLNCVRAGYVKHPDEYRWCSHRHYLKRENNIVDAKVALKFFSEDAKAAVGKYKLFINDGIKQTKRENFYEVVDQRFLGTDAFVHSALEKSSDDLVNFPQKYNFADIWQAVEQVSGLRKTDIIGTSRHEDVLAARIAFIKLCKKFSGAKVSEIAAQIKRDPALVSRLGNDENEFLKRKAERKLLESYPQS